MKLGRGFYSLKNLAEPSNELLAESIAGGIEHVTGDLKINYCFRAKDDREAHGRCSSR